MSEIRHGSLEKKQIGCGCFFSDDHKKNLFQKGCVMKKFAITIFLDFTPAAGAAAHALYAKFYGSPPHPRAHAAWITCVERGMQL